MERASRDPVPDPGDELVDVVDEQDRVVATVTRREIRRENLRHRAVGIVVFDPRGRVLAHRRSDAKDVWPGRWDLAAGGVVASGEDYATAAARELAEELGVEGAELVHVGTGPYADDVVRSCCAYFTTVWGGAVTFADGEVAEARWIEVAEARRLLAGDALVPDTRHFLLRFLPEVFAGPPGAGHPFPGIAHRAGPQRKDDFP